MSTPLPTKFQPTTASTATKVQNTVMDKAQDGTPFVRVLGATKWRVSVEIFYTSDADTVELLNWLGDHRSEQISVTIASGTYTGFISSDPQRRWTSGNYSKVTFEIYG